MNTLPPGPRTPRVLNSYRVLAQTRQWMSRWFETHGDPFTLRAVNGTVVITARPDLIKQIFTADPATLDPFGERALEPLVGPGSIFMLRGDAHRRERKLLMPPFHGSRMRAYAEIMAEVARRHFAEAAAAAEPVKLIDVSQRISLEIIVRTVFGADEVDLIDRYADTIKGLVESAHPALLFMPFLQKELGGIGPYARFKRHWNVFDRMLQEQIDAARSREPGVDILSMMLGARYEDGEPMEDEHIRSELRTLLFAGHETTAISLAWAVEGVGRNPEVLTQLLAALDSLGESPTPEELAACGYTDAVAKETMRLYPIVTDVIRTLNAPMKLGDHELPAGTCVAAAIESAHLRPEAFPEPHAFRPERFIDQRHDAFTYLPFGGGHRRCIGAAFASFEIKIILGVLYRDFELELLEPTPARPVRRNITMAPGSGVPVRIKPRAAGTAAAA